MHIDKVPANLFSDYNLPADENKSVPRDRDVSDSILGNTTCFLERAIN